LYKSPRGTVDILPEEQIYWRYIESKAVALGQVYGYQRLDTPIFEDSKLFLRSIGESTDIVTKEMYVFKDLSDNELALKPEGTAPICRSYLEHGMGNLPQPVKLYYLSPIFRYERPQAGRYRQHHQFGFEAIGEADASVDAEVIDMAWSLYSSLGLKGISLQLNSIGCRACRPAYLVTLKQYYHTHMDGLCNDCKTRFENNPLRLLDCKQPFCQGVADNAPKSCEHLCPECNSHFEEVQKYLAIYGLQFNINHRLVRGLDYYTRTVFEIHPPEEGSQSALGGGGRYDNLIEQLGGKPTPAIGFASGIERIVLNLKRQQVSIADLPRPKVLVAYMGIEAKAKAVQLVFNLRRNGTGALMAAGDRSLKAQLRYANALAINQVAIIGEDEVKNQTVTLRDMTTSEQKTISVKEFEDSIRVA
jgi:histidyl-tRNA synthetase